MRQKYKATITYWPKTGEDRFGDDSFSTPVTMLAHWEDRNENVRLPTGEEVVSRSIVYTELEVAMGGYLAKGDHTGQADPVAVGGKEIMTVAQIPSLRTNQSEFRAFL